jgi:uncharacterized RDD family membrane protein YckC
MKCPKCGYLGFEQLDRCRNCGYDFSLLPAPGDPELPIREPREPRPLEDQALVGELPLFGTRVSDDVPLITKPSPPRAPLAVRRATPEPARTRLESRAPMLDFVSEAELPPPPDRAPDDAPAADFFPEETPTEPAGGDAAVGARVAAGAIDLLILGAVDVMVVYFTLQICGLGPGDLGLLPVGPLLAFLLVQNGSYLVAFTAGGQTLGKMATGIRVVGATPDQPVDLGRATMRELVWLVLAIPAGLGFLTAVLSADHRGLHDRFAGTRVVRTAA